MADQSKKVAIITGAPEDIANAVAFLVSPAGGWVNCQTIRVNGGIF